VSAARSEAQIFGVFWQKIWIRVS